MIFIAQGVYVVFCIAFAYLNYRWIIKGTKIHHPINGLLHAIAWLLLLWLCNWNLKLLIVLPLIGKCAFDIALDKFRGYPLAYISLSKKSFLDKVELWVFDNPVIAKVIYLTFIISINIWYVSHR